MNWAPHPSRDQPFTIAGWSGPGRVAKRVAVLARDVDTTRDMATTNPEIFAYCPRTGAQLRAATSEERAAYLTQHPAECFRRRIVVGGVAVDSWTGPGAAHVPGRFLGSAS